MEFRPYSREEPEEAEQWLTRLKHLYLANADEEFLAFVADHLDRLEGTPFDELYDEIADRALCCALQSGELKRITTVVLRLRPAAVERPMARLAQAVLHLANGRLREASDALDATGQGKVQGEEIVEWLEEVVPPLRALSAYVEDGSMERYAAKVSPEVTAALRTVSLPLRRQLHDYLRLERALWHHYGIPGLAELPQTVGLRSREGRLLWSFFRTLKGFRIGIYRPGPRTVRKLEQVLEEAQEAEPSSGYQELFDASAERLRLFQRLLDLERVLGRVEPPVEVARRRLQEFLTTNQGSFIRLLSKKPPALLGNLEYAWRHRWHELLEHLGKCFDRVQWSEFYAFYPQILSYHLVPLEPDPGAHQAMQYLRIDRLIRGEEYGELAQFLAKQSRKRSLRPDQLVRLWGCELWARRRVLSPPQPPTVSSELLPEGQSMLSRFLRGNPKASEVRYLLARLEEMALALKQRFTAGEGLEVARVLRDEMLLLIARYGFSENLKPLVEALLEALPSDLELLIVGMVAAEGAGDEKAKRQLSARFARKRLSAKDLVQLFPLLRALVLKPLGRTATVLQEVKSSLGGKGWNRLTDFLPLEIRHRLVLSLWCAVEAFAARDIERLSAMRRLEQEIRDYRSLLGDLMELAAAEVVMECWWLDDGGHSFDAPHQFFSRFTSLEASVVLFCFAALMEPGEHEAQDRLRELSLETMIKRLDPAWHVWRPAIPLLALRCGPVSNDRLCQRIKALLAREDLTSEESQPLRTAIQHLRIFRDTSRPSEPLENVLPNWELPAGKHISAIFGEDETHSLQNPHSRNSSEGK